MLRRKRAQLTEGVGNCAAAVCGQGTELAHGVAYIAALIWREAFHLLATLNDTLALLRWHGVQPLQAVEHTLLRLLGQLVESRFMGEGALLILRVQLVVVLHPLLQMLTPDRAGTVVRLLLPETGSSTLPLLLLRGVVVCRAVRYRLRIAGVRLPGLRVAGLCIAISLARIATLGVAVLWGTILRIAASLLLLVTALRVAASLLLLIAVLLIRIRRLLAVPG